VRERVAIACFWRWFEQHETSLRRPRLDASLIGELESRLFELERFDWEIGEGHAAARALTLSSANLPGLRKAQRLVARAPRLAGWEFWAGKPARRWAVTFEVERRGTLVFVDGTAWEFVARRRRRGRHDLLLKPPASLGLSEAEADCVGVIIVDGELGEAARLELVASIEVVANWTPADAAHARSLSPGALARALRAASQG